LLNNHPTATNYFVEMPFAVEGKTLLGQIRKKASNEEIQETIDKIHEQANEQGITDALAISTDVLVTAICRVGATSLSHVLSYIDRNKDRLVGISQESDSARSQIVTSVVEYWKFQPGVAVHIINLLLNYKVLAPINVIQWVFDTYMGAGDALAKSWIYELVANTVAKQSSRNLEIVTYRLQKGLSEEAAAAIDEQLKLDRGIVRELFKFIDDALKGYAEGSADRLIEKETNGEISTEDGQLIRDWGKRWRTVFTRKATIEESVVGEEAVEAKLRYLAAQPDEEPEAMQAEDTNGAQAEDMMDEVL
jgi:nuclear cap-binding protein subunit 1